MLDLLERFVTNLGGRIGGPMSFRLLMQPAMAILLAVRAGRADAASGRPPYLWTIVMDRDHRGDLVREGWKAIASVFVVAVAIDAVYQVVVLGWFYPGEALFVAFVLACVPYVAIRGLVNRFMRGR